MAKTAQSEELIFTGIPASPGIAVGPIHVSARGFSAPEIYEIAENQVAEEQSRFQEAVNITKKQLKDLQERLESLAGNSESEIFEAHVMLLEDKSLIERVLQAIEKRGVCVLRSDAEFFGSHASYPRCVSP